tara:strand:- start:547289 stop:548197 length:909 start_codon:yes stop_codon:yes gene_type:complete
MKILIVASGNSNALNPFIADQMAALMKEHVVMDYFLIKGSGVSGYLSNYKALLKKIKEYNPDILHAHYGLSGLFASLQRKKPVITTFHGCDVNVPKLRAISFLADKLSAKSIFISTKLANKLNKKDPTVIPCGIDLDVFYPMDKNSAREKLNLSKSKKYILFSSAFSNHVKNFPLAQEAVSMTGNKNLEILELKGYNREEVALLMNAVDLVLLTSLREGSPQFIKEAMSCNTPIVSVDVGDVKDVISTTKGCYIAENNSEDISFKIEKALELEEVTKGRENIQQFDNKIIAKDIIAIYNSII